MKAVNRVTALNTLVELYNVYSKLIDRNVTLNKSKLNDYTIMFDGILSESFKDSIQPILDKNNLIIEKIDHHMLIHSRLKVLGTSIFFV